MDFPWKRAFASVFILLSLNNGHVLSQNMQAGALPLPVLRDPLWELAGLTAPAPKQMGIFVVPPNTTPGLMPLEPNQVETQLRRPILQDSPRQPANVSRIGLINPQTVPCNTIPQNIGTIQRSPPYNLPPFMNSPTLQSQSSNIPPVTLTPTLPNPQGSIRALPVPPLNTKVATEPRNPGIQLTPTLYPQAYTSPPVGCPIPNEPNFQISSVSPILNIQQPCNSFPVNLKPTSDDSNPMPITLQINVPPPNVTAPKINVITVLPGPPENTGISLETCGPNFLPPIIIEETRSSKTSLLPLLLMALVTRDGYQDGGCGGCCCCPCNMGNSDIPIPFPIPIPTNNPIILGKPHSRKRSSKCG